jgi:REP element-mobilizing transposase RayT
MRRARLKREPEAEAAYYHCISRVVDRRFILDAPQKEAFVRLMRGYETYCGVQIITFCVMSNHLHVLLRVPRRPSADLLPSDAELVERLRKETGTGNFSGSSGFLDKIQPASTRPT